jgi:hypothetical protein
MLRDPRYLLPLGLLVAVIMISFVAGRGNTHAQTGALHHATVTATPQPTPDDAIIDARRTGDLQRLTDALAVYVKRHGEYPSTHNAIMQVCGSDTDAGCALKAVAPDLIFSDAGDPYYYASDGNRYVLISREQATSDACACPVGLPAELVAGPVICRSGEAKN